MATNEDILEELRSLADSQKDAAENTAQNGLAIVVLQTEMSGVIKRLDDRNPFVEVFLNTARGIGNRLSSGVVSQALTTIVVLMLISVGSLAAMSRAGFGVKEALGNVDTMIETGKKLKDLVPGDSSQIHDAMTDTTYTSSIERVK